MNVLSLFDGKSGAYSALKSIGIIPTSYFASEIDKYAEAVSKYHFPSIIRLGDVNRATFFGLPKIDLLIAGFPCQSFSIAGNQLNFNDPRGKLFFEVIRLIHEIKPKYFLLENVQMKKEIQYKINELVGVEPIMINSSLLSAQSRKRLYWTNISNVIQPHDKNIMLKDIIIDATTDRDKSFCIDANYQKGASYESYIKKHRRQLVLAGDTQLTKQESDNRVYDVSGKSPTIVSHHDSEPKITTNGNTWRKLNIIECERLQTYSDNYTKYGIINDKVIEISNQQRYKMIGNGFTRAVISHILRFMN